MCDSWHSCQIKDLKNVTPVAGRGRKSEHVPEACVRKREGKRLAVCLGGWGKRAHGCCLGRGL